MLAEKPPAESGGTIVRLKFETIFLLLVWIAVILLVILYPRFGSH